MRRSALLVELWECVIFSFQQAGILLPWAEIGQERTFTQEEKRKDTRQLLLALETRLLPQYYRT